MSYHRVLCLFAAGRYHDGVAPGDVSQTGQLVTLLLDSVAKQGSYVEADYTAQLDQLLDTLDGTPYSGTAVHHFQLLAMSRLAMVTCSLRITNKQTQGLHLT